MLNFDYCMPTRFAFGDGAEKQTGALVKKYGGHKVLVVYGGGSVKNNGALGDVLAALESEGIEYMEFGGIQPNPKSGKVYEGIALCKKENIDFLLAVGGGSAIDTAKAIAAGVAYSGDFWDFFGHRKSADEGLPVGVVLTIAAAGSEASCNAVITHEETLQKWGAHGEALIPKFSVLNPRYTQSLPAYQTACGITDIIAHVLERYFTSTSDVELTDRLCEGIIKAVMCEAPRVIKNPADYQARANIMWAGAVAHNDTCGVGRAQDWGAHAVEHELSALFGCAHGAGLAIILPAWMKRVYSRDIDRFVRLAVNVFGVENNPGDPEGTAQRGIARFEEFLKTIGMPLTLGEAGITKDDIPKMTEHAKIDGKIEIGACIPLSEEDVAEIYALAL